MTTKEFINDAIKGGWWVEERETIRELIAFGGEEILLKRVVLDPEAWNAVGKSRGWNDGENQPEIHIDAYAQFFWQSAMYAMVHALINGKTLEEYIATL